MLHNPSLEFKNYFTSLGYTVDWDYSKESNEYWYEIYKDGQLVLQIDQGIPLEDVILDLISCHTGKPAESSGREYKISGPENELTKDLYKLVYEHGI